MPLTVQEQTVFVSKSRGPSLVDRATTSLPPDLTNRIPSRLQSLAWLYAFTFFMAAFFPAFFFPGGATIFERAVDWVP
ncbi:MAG: hypothetical protein ACM36C_07975, partial [Acidobacteriota bacterium]